NRIRVIFAGVLLLGIVLSVFVYMNGRAVQNVSEPLLRQQLPALQMISNLQLMVAAQEPILYQYYSTVDRTEFRRRYQLNDDEIRRTLERLSDGMVAPSRLEFVRQYCSKINQLAEELDNTLKVYGDKRVDWDRARHVLEQVSAAGRQVNRELETYAGQIRNAVRAGSTETRQRFNRVITAVLTFSFVLGVLSALMAFMTSAYMSNEAERQKLAMFVEENPSPVLSISTSGEVKYANPSASRMHAALSLGNASLSGLLPANVKDRLQKLRKGDGLSERFEYAISGRMLDCSLVYLPEHRVYHCYLADVTDRKKAEAGLREQAMHDSVTGLPNRRFLAEEVETLNERDRYALMLINFDRFHKFLGNVGPEVVDETLRTVADRLSAIFPPLRSRPQLYRYEGDSFVLLVPVNRQDDDGMKLAQQALSVLREAFEVGGRQMFLSASIGISHFPRDGMQAPELVHNAGTALHAVKQSGGGTWRVYDANMSSSAKERMATESDLRLAVEKRQLFLEFQPQADLASGRILASEALVRWSRFGYGLVPPDKFIPIAEETGLITALGDWVLEQACHCAVRWQREKCEDVGVAVNISALQFQAPGLVDRVRDVLRETGLAPSLLELEITEGSAMDDVERTVLVLDQLKRLGVKLAIDDFGTGFSSMNYLSRFPIDRLKIDQSFIRDMVRDDAATEIVAAVISLGQKLRLKVIAEGVETQSQLDKLRELGCDEIQGYLLSKPIREVDLIALLQYSRAERGTGEAGFFGQSPGFSSAV
ncbi:MAG: EAL domain-containing protein, partial [Burkholderiales bacterium]